MKLFTIGFTKKTAREFFTLLKNNQINKVVDVRLNNSSQLAGFAKGKDIEYILEEFCKISYIHATELAPNKEILNDYKNKKKDAELVKVYEKLRDGIWVYNGLFKLIDAWQEESNARKVFKFKLELTDENINEPENKFVEIEHNRIIPTSVKLEVWKRDKGKCVICGRSDNLHFDHIIPYSKGGSSLVAENIQLLCARHNLEKRDRII